MTEVIDSVTKGGIGEQWTLPKTYAQADFKWTQARLKALAYTVGVLMKGDASFS